MVALFTGAWIETGKLILGLVAEQVALFTGAWIETIYAGADGFDYYGRALHGRVD